MADESSDVGFSDAELEQAKNYLDLAGAINFRLKKEVESREELIKTNDKQIKKYELNIKECLATNKSHNETITDLQKQLEAVPPSTYTLDSARAEIARCKALPWISSFALTRDHWLSITTVPGVLKTKFYQGLAYHASHRTEELLSVPVTLPLPTYTIEIDLSNFLRGEAWTRNQAVLRMGLAIRAECSTFISDMGWNHEPHAHWATNESGRSAGQLGDVCLGDYTANLHVASNRGLYEFLNELAMYLQTAGWSQAYRPKLTWACYLGNPTYNRYLIRQVESQEALDAIADKNRADLPGFLKKNGLSMHEYLYGSAVEGGDIGEPIADDTENHLFDEDE